MDVKDLGKSYFLTKCNIIMLQIKKKLFGLYSQNIKTLIS